jgi:hypothetical protein
MSTSLLMAPAAASLASAAAATAVPAFLAGQATQRLQSSELSAIPANSADTSAASTSGHHTRGVAGRDARQDLRFADITPTGRLPAHPRLRTAQGAHYARQR